MRLAHAIYSDFFSSKKKKKKKKKNEKKNEKKKKMLKKGLYFSYFVIKTLIVEAVLTSTHNSMFWIKNK